MRTFFVIAMAMAVCLWAGADDAEQAPDGAVHATDDAPSVEKGDPVITEAFQAEVAATFKDRQGTQGHDEDLMIRPGLIANRKLRTITLEAWGTGLREPSPVEFWITTSAGKTYEALTVCAASAEDLKAAAEFIGMPEGRVTDRRHLWFQPRGERVKATFTYTPTAAEAPVTVAAHAMVWDRATNKVLPDEGWTYTSSVVLDFDGEKQLLAEASGDVASAYNSSDSLFTVPHTAVQEAVYGERVPNPAHPLDFRQPVTITITPELPVGQTRTRDMVLTVHPPAGDAAAVPDNLRFSLVPYMDPVAAVAPPEPVVDAGDFDALLAAIQKELEAGHDLWVRIRFAPGLTLAPMPMVMTVFDELAIRDIIRIEPERDTIYYQAFITKPDWLDPEERLVHPMEVRPTTTDLTAGGELSRLFEVYPPGKPKYIDPHHFAYKTVKELYDHLAAREDWESDTLFLITPPATDVAAITSWYAPMRDRFPVLYIFPETPAATVP